MIVRIDRSFEQDVDNIGDTKVLRKLQAIIAMLEEAQSISDIPQVKKIHLEVTSRQEIILIRLIHRKEIYRYFPPK